MSKIIEATNKLIRGDKEALALVDSIANNLSEDHYDFEDINYVNTKKEFILGYNVYYGLSKMKAVSKDGKSESIQYRLIIHGVFNGLGGARITDEEVIELVTKEIVARN